MSRKVLVIAEAANPEWISVPLVGWSLAEALKKATGAHIVTQVRNKEAFERAGWREGDDFTAIDSEKVARPISQSFEFLNRTMGLGFTAGQAVSALSYYYFERQLWKKFGAQIRGGQFDIVHRITPLSPTIPSYVAGKCGKVGVPFVIGPLNGGVAWPEGFGDVRRKEGEWLSYVRDAYKALPYYRSTRDKAAAIITGSLATKEQIGPKWQDKCLYVPENAISTERFPKPQEKKRAGPLRAAFVGRLVPYKGADVLIESALELLVSGKLVIDIIGDGPEMPRLKKMVADLGVDQAVSLEGWVEHTQLASRLQEADIFAFPSIREFGGGVVLEAMSLGLVPVVADYAGPAELVTNETGFRVPFNSRETLVSGFRQALGGVIERQDDLPELSRNARSRVERWFTWERKAEQMEEIYSWVLGEGPRPGWDAPFAD